MQTILDVGDKIEVTLKGKVIGYTVDRYGKDCYTIQIEDPKRNDIWVYLSTDDLLASGVKRVDRSLVK